MIEVIESYSAKGVQAEVVGGKQIVTITPDEGRWLEGNYTDSFRWPNHKTDRVWLPNGYYVNYGRHQYTRVLDYNRAIKLAVYHAKRSGGAK